MPFVIPIIFYLVPYVSLSFRSGEVSTSASSVII